MKDNGANDMLGIDRVGNDLQGPSAAETIVVINRQAELPYRREQRRCQRKPKVSWWEIQW